VRVAIALPAGEAFVAALRACVDARVTAVPIDLRLTEAERAQRLRGADLVIDAPLRAPLEAGDGHELVVFTSGTTSEPKEVVLTWGNIRAHAEASKAALGLGDHERWLCPMPLTHVGGLMILYRSWIHGWEAAVERFDAAAVAGRLNRGEATIVSLVPTMLARVLDAGLREPPGLRCVVLGGAPIDPALLRRAADAGVPVVETYGLTEACSMVTVAGRPLPGVDVRLAEDGEILVSGPVVAGGGVLRTGDLGAFDDAGRLAIVGRKADTIVSGGENVAPAEVEAVLLAHPDVAEAGVFARPHPEWGEAVTAQVVARAPVDPEDLRRWCAERLAPYKVPKAVELVDALPRTASGKLLRRSLR
jgi:O-succinylbenzoic acid--CoA ligase